MNIISTTSKETLTKVSFFFFFKWNTKETVLMWTGVIPSAKNKVFFTVVILASNTPLPQMKLCSHLLDSRHTIRKGQTRHWRNLNSRSKSSAQFLFYCRLAQASNLKVWTRCAPIKVNHFFLMNKLISIKLFHLISHEMKF